MFVASHNLFTTVRYLPEFSSSPSRRRYPYFLVIFKSRDLIRKTNALSPMGLAHFMAVESLSRPFIRVHIAQVQNWFLTGLHGFLLYYSASGPSSLFFNVKSSHVGLWFLAMRSPMVLTLEFQKLKVFSAISTLVRAISGKLQSKEIIGIVKDIRSISSGFASIYVYHFSTLPAAFCDKKKDVPEKSEKKTVIYVKKGVYFENVKVEKTMWNVVFVGDGGDKSIVSGKLNVIDGTPTFQSATFTVFGKGFMARDMGFINTAGPSKHQAVALMVSADLAAFYRCTMNAYQDTLYVHAQRQFYRECTIIGTVDFIFGNAASVLQSCKIRPRRPMQGQQNTITAQGRKDPNQNTGISIHRCNISPLGNLTGVQTFLGRPWKDFSTTVIMESSLHGFIDPKGWLPWVGDSAPDTIFYGEYKNIGAGASTKNRVKWKGLRFLSTKEANRFTVKPFIDGERWLPTTKVPFRSGL
ncbi:hypothetical protein F2Q68_00032989 [Brassica cretica]|uniref:Pectinesterase n=1 Tax=Brassica cretica TaxID=69181 RepID=A0A8S9GAK5_BRACR|nr:hypothetical protein F2Q68_00032989 [Brassica cretica]